MAVPFVLGALGWTAAEYVLHRFLFHSVSRSSVLAVLGVAEHRRHHAEVDYFAPAHLKLAAALTAFAVMLPFANAVSDKTTAFQFTCGFACMYLMYEVMHKRCHTHAPVTALGRWRRRHHFAHHFREPKLAHGVSFPLWDYIFGTTIALEQVPVPRRLAMPWLLDAQGEIRPEYIADYRLVGKKKTDAKRAEADRAAALRNERPE